MEFTKYRKQGAYHWKMYDDPNTKYHRHANRLVEWIKERPVLDVGAGDGKITDMLGAVGFDNDLEGIKLAQAKGVPVVFGDAYKFPFRSNSFMAVFAGDVFEHLEFPLVALREVHRVTSKYFYIASPLKGADNDKFHYEEWTPEELQALIEPVGFKLIEPIFTVAKDKRIYGKFEKIIK